MPSLKPSLLQESGVEQNKLMPSICYPFADSILVNNSILRPWHNNEMARDAYNELFSITFEKTHLIDKSKFRERKT